MQLILTIIFENTTLSCLVTSLVLVKFGCPGAVSLWLNFFVILLRGVSVLYLKPSESEWITRRRYQSIFEYKIHGSHDFSIRILCH